MKKILFFALILAGFIFNSQRAYSQDPNFVIPRNPEVTVVGKDGSRAIANDVYSQLSRLKRNVRLIDPNGSPIGEAFIVLESLNEKVNIYDQVKQDPSSFSGIISFVVDGNPTYVRKILNGVIVKDESSGNKLPDDCCPPQYNPNLTCTVGHVHDCVAYTMEGMNWVKFVLCVMSAPGCYIGTWLSCMWEVCRRHMQYTNPN